METLTKMLKHHIPQTRNGTFKGIMDKSGSQKNKELRKRTEDFRENKKWN